MSASDPSVSLRIGNRPSRGSLSEVSNLRKRSRTACTRCKNRKQKCDEQLPICSNCLRAGAECDKAAVSNQAPPIAYTRALEERVAQLEILLAQTRASQENHIPLSSPNERPAPPSPVTSQGNAGGRGQDMNALDEVVGIISLGNFEAPAYVGPSAGLSLAVNLGEMVQATVWKKAIPHVSDGAASPTASEHKMALGGVRAMTMEELIRYGVKEPPSDELGSHLVNLYVQQIHPRYPLLNPVELWRLQKERTPVATSAGGGALTMVQRYGVFKLYMVFAIGATLLQLTSKSADVSAERFYMAALQHMAAAKEPRTIQNIEAMALLVIYHLRTASGLGLWYMIGLAMRTCIDIGMHRKAHEQGLSPPAIQARRRLFWTVYSLERVIAIALGRPLSIAERQIDVEFPDAASEISSPTFPESPYNDDLRLANLLFRLRRIEARIQHSIYRTDRPLNSLRPKMERLHADLEAWRLSLTEALPADSHALDYPLLLYHRAVRMLIQPFLTILPVSDPYYSLCLSAAGNICQMHKRLHQTLRYGHSFIAVQTVFVAGVTLLYGLWTQHNLVWSVTLSNDLRACSLVLFIMSERAPWVRKYRDAFEVLVDAAMEKLRSGESSLAEMIAMAESQARRTDPEWIAQPTINRETMGGPELGGGPEIPSYDTVADGGDRRDVWRLVNELANWIDQDQETAPVWMPDFEAMQNLSGDEPH